MAKKYTRKHLGNLDELDKEQERIRNKSKSIEYDFVEMINPQQLAITLVGNFLNKKIKGGKKGKGESATGKGNFAFSGAGLKIKDATAHPLFKTVLKKVGFSFLQWQAFNLALFAGKKIYHTIKEKKRQKAQKLLPVVISKK